MYSTHENQQEPLCLAQSVSGNLIQLTVVVHRVPGDPEGLEGQGKLTRNQ